jgi:hypothetical protein
VLRSALLKWDVYSSTITEINDTELSRIRK